MAILQVTIDVIDTYAPGTYHIDDLVTATIPSVGLLQGYAVKRIMRDMTKPYYAQLDLNKQRTELWEMDENTQTLLTTVAVAVGTVT